jgi:hypothetical protein
LETCQLPKLFVILSLFSTNKDPQFFPTGHIWLLEVVQYIIENKGL